MTSGLKLEMNRKEANLQIKQQIKMKVQMKKKKKRRILKIKKSPKISPI